MPTIEEHGNSGEEMSEMEKHLHILQEAMGYIHSGCEAIGGKMEEMSLSFQAFLNILNDTTGLLHKLNDQITTDIQRHDAEDGDIT